MFTKKYLQFLILALFMTLAGSLNLWAQGAEDPPREGLGTYILKSEKGFLLVHNRQPISYTIEFKGQTIKPMESDHPVFLIDGQLLQVVSVEREKFLKPTAGSTKEPTVEEVLESHKVWESDYIGESLNAKLSVTSEIFEIMPKRKVMFWSFPMPKEAKAALSHYLFLTTAIGNDILGLNSSIKTPEEQKSSRAYLVESMNTLKTSDKLFIIKDIQEQIRNAKPLS